MDTSTREVVRSGGKGIEKSLRKHIICNTAMCTQLYTYMYMDTCAVHPLKEQVHKKYMHAPYVYQSNNFPLRHLHLVFF